MAERSNVDLGYFQEHALFSALYRAKGDLERLKITAVPSPLLSHFLRDLASPGGRDTPAQGVRVLPRAFSVGTQVPAALTFSASFNTFRWNRCSLTRELVKLKRPQSVDACLRFTWLLISNSD